MSNTERQVPESGAALAAVLNEEQEAATKIRERIHRSQLWRYTTGRGQPDANQIAFMHRVTKGRIAADGWALKDLGAGSAAA